MAFSYPGIGNGGLPSTLTGTTLNGTTIITGTLILGSTATVGNIQDASATERFGWTSGGTVISGSLGTAAITIVAGTTNATFTGGILGTGATGGNQGAGTGNFSALYVNGVAVGTSTGNVSTTGSPAATQIAVFTSGTVITGAGATISGSTIKSASTVDLVLGTTSFGTAVTFTSANGNATFVGTISSQQATVRANSIAATSTDGSVLQNLTAAALGAQQWSPRIHWIGQGWETSTSASQTVEFWAEVQPIQGASNPTGNWVVTSRVNSGTVNAQLAVTNANGTYSPFGFFGNIQGTASGTNGVFFPSTTTVSFYTNGAVAVAIDSSQNSVFSGVVRGQSSIVSNHPTNGVGYTTGAGGTIVQGTNKSTAFTLSKVSGQVTFAAGSLGAGATAVSIWTNTAVGATDTITFSHVSGGTLGAYTFIAQCGAGTVNLAITNISTGSLNEQPIIQFTLNKGVTS